MMCICDLHCHNVVHGLQRISLSYSLLVLDQNQELPRQPNQRKGQNEKFMNFAHFLVNSMVFLLRKTSTIHIECLFRNAPVKSS